MDIRCARIGYRYKASDDTDEAALQDDRKIATDTLMTIWQSSYSVRLRRPFDVPNHRNDYAQSPALDQENAKTVYRNFFLNISY